MSLNNTKDFNKKVNQFFDAPATAFDLSSMQQIGDVVCLLLSLTQDYWQQGALLLEQLLDQQDKSIKKRPLFPPVLGGLLWHYYEKAPSKEEGEALLQQFSCRIVHYHTQLYTDYDLQEIGLIDTAEANSKPTFFDLFFHTFLVWSNQAIIKIRAIMAKDDVDIILWNELSVFSCQERLWSPATSRFYSMNGNKKVNASKRKDVAFLPLFSNIPTQEEAEEMLKAMQGLGFPMNERGETPQVPKNIKLSFPIAYFLYRGLLNYDMKEAAVCLKTYILARKGQKTLAKLAVRALLETE